MKNVTVDAVSLAIIPLNYLKYRNKKLIHTSQYGQRIFPHATHNIVVLLLVAIALAHQGISVDTHTYMH